MRAECYSLYVICTYVCIYMYIVVSVTKSRAEHNDETVVMFAEKIHCSDLINRQPPLTLPPYFNAACFFRTSHNLAKSGKLSRSALKIRITCFTTLLIPFDQKIIFGFRVDVIVNDILVLRDNDNYFWYKRVNMKNVSKCDNAKATCA